jgi:cobalt/nickel transport system permease protein
MFDLIFSEHTTDRLFIGKVDPRAKIILLLSFISVVLIVPSYDLMPLLILGLTLVLLISISGLPGIKIVKSIIKIYPMILVMSIFQVLTIKSGDYLYSGVGFFDISEESWIRISGFQLKTILIVAAGLFLISSTPMNLFLSSMKKLRAPGWLVAVAFFIYHFVFILSHELRRLQIAYQSRYIKLSIVKRLSVQAKLLAVFLTRLFERNDRLYNALISRGFNGIIPLEIPISWKYSDTILVFSGIVFIILTPWIT